MKYILDTSVAIKFYIEEAGTEKSEKVLREALLGRIELVAPCLIYFEINSSLAKKGISSKKRDEYFNHFSELVNDNIIKIINPDNRLFKEAYDMAQLDTKSHGYISTFDATFHALAIKEKCDFLTADEAHIRRTEKLVGSVKNLADFKI